MAFGYHPSQLGKTPAEAVQEFGVYVLKDPNLQPGVLIPVVSMGGKLYAVRLDQELSVEGFSPDAKLEGPFK